MTTLISKENLKWKTRSNDGLHRTFSVSLEHLKISSSRTDELNAYATELRSLIRSKDNLDEAIGMLEELEEKFGHDPFVPVYSGRALFYSAVILYGACFVKGGSSNSVPLKFFVKDLASKKMHEKIMTYRHKLLSHLDEDHDVRTDKLKWELVAIDDSQLSPKVPHLDGNKVLLYIGAFNHECITHIRDLISKVEIRRDELTSTANKIIGEIKLID